MQSFKKVFGTRLTRREQEILNYISLGYATKHIASTLQISEYTVANHRKNVLKKRGAKTIRQLLGR